MSYPLSLKQNLVWLFAFDTYIIGTLVSHPFLLTTSSFSLLFFNNKILSYIGCYKCCICTDVMKLIMYNIVCFTKV